MKCRFAKPIRFAVRLRAQNQKRNQTLKDKMKTTRILTLAALIASTLMLPVARADEKCAAAGDIVAVASGAGTFNTLVAAVKAAGLVETLQGAGPFTVFATADRG
jgi:uncharacterized surface protein with fasciclin (FAS1) repeats